VLSLRTAVGRSGPPWGMRKHRRGWWNLLRWWTKHAQAGVHVESLLGVEDSKAVLAALARTLKAPCLMVATLTAPPWVAEVLEMRWRWSGGV